MTFAPLKQHRRPQAYTNLTLGLLFFLFPCIAMSADSDIPLLVNYKLAYVCLVVFIVAYLAVIFEEALHLRKSKPMLLASGIIWALISVLVSSEGLPLESVEKAVMFDLEEYAALFLFLLVAMTYVNVLDERGVFSALRVWLIGKGFSYRQLFWLTGIIAFFLSPIADNLTTALVMGAVIMSVGADSPRFCVPALINVVVAANAGGAFSPFGDITTLMVWQADKVDFFVFFNLFLPSVVNFLVPAMLMTLAIPDERPEPVITQFRLRKGALGMTLLFLITISLAVTFEQVFHLPAFLGMITGLSLLMFYTYYLKLTTGGYIKHNRRAHERKYGHLDTFEKVALAEWDTLFFFFGVIFAVGGLGFLGYLQVISVSMYGDYGPLSLMWQQA